MRLQIQRYGPADASVGMVEGTMGMLAIEENAPGRAARHFRRALEIAAKTSGADSLAVAGALENLGLADLGLHRYREAYSGFAKALAIRQKREGRTTVRPSSGGC